VDEDAVVIGRDASAAIESLIGDVRRALWLGELKRAARAAMWAWAAIMSLAAVLNALTGRPGLATALAIGGIAWCVALAAAALRRPDAATAALHADRRLEGQSAYSTWLEERTRDAVRLDTPAGQRLLEWTAAAVPTSRQALGRQRTHWRLLRPAAAAAICTAMAIAVTMLGGARPASTPVAVESTPRGPASAGTPRLDEAALADALAAEFSTSDSRVDAAAGGSARQPSTDGSGAAAPGQADDAALPGDETTTLRRTATGATAAPGTGREAGSTRDDSAPGAGSRAAPGSMLVQRRDVSGSADDDERLADDERVASYADESTARATAAGVIVDAAAARPPAARREARLSPAEAAYVANWRADLRTADQEQR
jgi:hypothetical protein